MWVRLTVAVARHEDVRLAYIVAQVEDLTAERRAAREPAAQDERFRLLADGADDVVVARIRTTPDLPAEYRSRGGEAMIGRPPEDFQADPGLLPESIHPADRAEWAGLTADPGRFHGDSARACLPRSP